MSDVDTVTAHVLASLRFAPTARRFVAYSGGIDSTVLLHALATCGGVEPSNLTALHVDHAIQPASSSWANECRTRAAVLGVACRVHVVPDKPPAGMSIEAWARRVRYAAFERELRTGDVLLMAHHRDDQAETLLLRLMRGAGPEGLAGMPAVRSIGRGQLQRPLLDVDRSAIESYADAHGLEWSEDPSNLDLSHDRNYLRHAVLPALRQRWPGAVKRISSAAILQGEAAQQLNADADGILAQAVNRADGTLAIPSILAHTPPRQRWILRRWLEHLQLPRPDAAHVAEIQRLMSARRDRNPIVCYGNVEVRRYRDRLYAAHSLPHREIPQECGWNPAEPLRLPWGELCCVPARGPGLSRAALAGGKVTVRFRQGGERCRPAGRGNSHTLKHLFQEWGVPPWQRADTPLIYIDNELAAVAAYCVCDPYSAATAEDGLRIVWTRAQDAES